MTGMTGGERIGNVLIEKPFEIEFCERMKSEWCELSKLRGDSSSIYAANMVRTKFTLIHRTTVDHWHESAEQNQS